MCVWAEWVIPWSIHFKHISKLMGTHIVLQIIQILFVTRKSMLTRALALVNYMTLIPLLRVIHSIWTHLMFCQEQQKSLKKLGGHIHKAEVVFPQFLLS